MRYALFIVALLLIGCADQDRQSGATNDRKADRNAPSGKTSEANADTGKDATRASEPGASAATLADRAAEYWRAREQENTATLFRYLPADLREESTVKEYDAWFRENEALVIESATVKRVVEDDDLGWAEVDYKSRVRKMPKLPPREATTWQKWRRTAEDGWQPVPDRARSEYPEAPPLRDADAEYLLRQRVEQWWQARLLADIDTMLSMADPEDRPSVRREDFTDVATMFEYRDYRIHWVEVMGQRGRVRISVDQKAADLRKAPYRTTAAIEHWIKRGGEWYIDLKREE